MKNLSNKAPIKSLLLFSMSLLVPWNQTTTLFSNSELYLGISQESPPSTIKFYTSYLWFLAMLIILETACLISKLVRKSSKKSSIRQITTVELKECIMHYFKMLIQYSLCYSLYRMIIVALYFVCSTYNTSKQKDSVIQHSLFTEPTARSLETTYSVMSDLSAATDSSDDLLFSSSPSIIQSIYLKSLNASIAQMTISSDNNIAYILTYQDVKDTSMVYPYDLCLEIFNVSNRTSPSLLTEFSLYSPDFDSDSSDFYFLASSSNDQTIIVGTMASLQIVDVSTLTSPASLSIISDPKNISYDSLEVSPDFTTIFASVVVDPTSKDYYQALQIIDITNATSPSVITSFQGSGFVLSDDFKTAFFFRSYYNKKNVNSFTNIDIMNITDLQSPQLISSILNTTASALQVYQENLYVESTSSFQIYNISNLTNITLTANYSFSQLDPDFSETDCFQWAVNFQIGFLLYSTTDYHIYIQIFNIANNTALNSLQRLRFDGDDTDLENAIEIFESPDGRHIFVLLGGGNLVVYDTAQPASLISLSQAAFSVSSTGITAVTISSDGKVAFITDNYQFEIVVLNLNLQARQALNLLENQIKTINSDIYPATVAFCSNNNELYLATCNNKNADIMMVFDASNPAEYTRISSQILNDQLYQFVVSSDENYIFGMTDPDESYKFVKFQVYSLPDMLLMSSVVIKQTSDDLEPSFAVTPDSNTLIILQSPHNFLIADISNKTNISEISNTVNESLSMSSVILSNDGQTAFIFGADLYTYDISTPSNPSLLFNYQFPESIVTLTQSPDNNTVFITAGSTDDSDHCTLYIIDIANLTSPAFISTLALHDGCTGPDGGTHSYVIPMEPNGQVLLLPLETYIAAIDVTILELPTPMDYYSMSQPNIVVCPNYDAIFALDGSDGDMTIITLYPENILYAESSSFQLGPTNSITLDLYTRNSGKTFDIELSSYKFTDMALSLLDDTYGNMNRAYSILPNWMDFDQNSGILTLAPDSGSQIGVYFLSGTLSLQMSNTTFIGIDSINNVTDSLDLMVTLVSLGYLDNQGYLTSSFDSRQPLLLTQQYRNIEPQIRKTMANYSIQASMSVYITQSLILTLPDSPSSSISIDTLSLEPLNIMITLEGSTASPPMFVSIGYPFTASFLQNNTAISMVMSLYNANSALPQLIIFLNQSVSCTANITIIDGLNPTLTQIVPDITQYFKISSTPIINTSYFQYQLARVSPETGDQFVFQIDSSTFTDLNNEPLTLSIQMQDPTLQVPEWLELKGYSLIGTPPEQLTGREMDLILIVSNQYQSAQIEFSLNAGISIEYIWKLIGTYGGALITMIGLLVYATRIYNILAKKYYRFSKDFTISVEQDIDLKTIYPIFFGSEPIHESQIITRHLDKKIAKEIGDSSKTKITTHFTDNAGRINRAKLIEAIEETAVEIGESNKAKLKLYTPVLTPEKEVINQIIINDYIIRLLDSNEAKPTKKAFNLIKRSIFNLADFDKYHHGFCTFSVNKGKLSSELQKHNIKIFNQVPYKEREINDIIEQSQSQLEEGLLATESTPENTITQSHLESAASIDLLIYVLEAYAFNNHLIDANVLQIDVIPKQKITGKWPEMIRTFLKLDLETVSFSKKGLIGCGIEYSIKESSLIFFGNAQRDIKDQTLVVQIVKSNGKILRELWVNGVDAEPERKPISEDVL